MNKNFDRWFFTFIAASGLAFAVVDYVRGEYWSIVDHLMWTLLAVTGLIRSRQLSRALGEEA